MRRYRFLILINLNENEKYIRAYLLNFFLQKFIYSKKTRKMEVLGFNLIRFGTIDLILVPKEDEFNLMQKYRELFLTFKLILKNENNEKVLVRNIYFNA